MFEEKQEYIQYLKEVKKVSKNTYTSYDKDLNKLLKFFEEEGIISYSKVTNLILNSFLLQMEREEYSAATIARIVVSVRSFMMYLFTQRVIESDPSLTLKAPKVNKGLPATLSEEQIIQLLALPDLTMPKGIRDKAMLELLYATGIKVSELIHLELQDLNFNHSIITCRSERKERLIPFGDSAKEALELYLNEARGHLVREESIKLLFTNHKGQGMSRQGFWKLLKGYEKKMGIEELTPQMLRNSFAVHLIEHGASINAVGEMLGYTDYSLASIYMNNKSGRVREEYRKAHPRA